MRWQEGGVGTVGLEDVGVGVVGAGCGNARVASRVKTAETGLHGHKPVGVCPSLLQLPVFVWSRVFFLLTMYQKRIPLSVKPFLI